MGCLTRFANATVIASKTTGNNGNNKKKRNASLPSSPSHVKSIPIIKHRPPTSKQPSVAEVERAIGAGIFRDHSPSAESDGIPIGFDFLKNTPIGQPEGDAEKKLRQAGEWIIQRTEGNSRSGQEILVGVCLNILPFWLFCLLVAFGIVKLPFSIPYLEDLLM